MPYRFRFSLLLALLLTVHATSAATPHPGGLDAYGCHHDRQHGGYHCHRGEFTGQSFVSQAEMQAARIRERLRVAKKDASLQIWKGEYLDALRAIGLTDPMQDVLERGQ